MTTKKMTLKDWQKMDKPKKEEEKEMTQEEYIRWKRKEQLKSRGKQLLSKIKEIGDAQTKSKKGKHEDPFARFGFQ